MLMFGILENFNLKKQCSRENLRGCWQNGRMAERVLPDTKQLAEPPKHLAKFLLKVDLDSLGQGASPGLKKLSKKVLKVTATTIGKSVTYWDKLFKTLK